MITSERPRLTQLAYRMLGSWSEAEDIAQLSLERWYRLDDAERAAIASPAAWLTTVASRLCLTQLSSARARRELYVGEWLPEPIPALTPPPLDPLDRVTLDDSVSMALMVVLESLTPAERVAYVLHEVFGLRYAEIAGIVGRSVDATRQAASSARRHLQRTRSRSADAAEHTRLVEAFQAACEQGELSALVAVLDPRVISQSDGNGMIGIARRPVVGAEQVARFLLGILRNPIVEASIERVEVNGALGFALVSDPAGSTRTVVGVVSFGIERERIRNIWITMAPEKLTAW